MSDTPFTDLISQVYEKLESRGFARMRDGKKQSYLNFSDYEEKLGFERIWLDEHLRLVIHSEKVAQARALYSYLTVNSASALHAHGWSLKTDFSVKGTGGTSNVWPKDGPIAHRRIEEQQISSGEYKNSLPPATAAFLEFWRHAGLSGRIRRYSDGNEFKQLITDLYDVGIVDKMDLTHLEELRERRLKQAGKPYGDGLNAVPFLSLHLELPVEKSAPNASLVADVVEREIRLLFDTFGFQLDEFIGKNMSTAKQLNSPNQDYFREYIGLLEYKKQIILQGPPGTGKTRLAKYIAANLLDIKVSDEDEPEEPLREHRCYKIVQFHPSYTYEDFVRGIVVDNDGKANTPIYRATNKVLAEFALQASLSDKKHVLIIDEINRANLSAVLGELIYALEYRGESVDSMYAVDGDHALTIPNNLYIIGTMNTADRSAGHIDYAIRRRFAFVDVLPTSLDVPGFNEELFAQVRALFFKGDSQERSEFLSEEFRPNDVALGHSYFITDPEDVLRMKLRLRYEVKPILLEYVKDGVLKETALTLIRELGK